MDDPKDPEIVANAVSGTSGEATIVNVIIGAPDNKMPLLPEAPPKYSEKPPENEDVSPKSDIFELYRVRLSLQIS